MISTNRLTTLNALLIASLLLSHLAVANSRADATVVIPNDESFIVIPVLRDQVSLIENGRFIESRSYRRLAFGFESEEECMESIRESGFVFNCYQNLDLYADGSVILLLTDILTPGVYRVDDSTLTLNLEANTEIEPTVRFSTSNNFDSLSQLPFDQLWELYDNPFLTE